MRLQSELDDGYWSSDVGEFLEQLTNALAMLDTLAQLQACAGGQALDGYAARTLNTKARLENALPVLRKHYQDDVVRQRGRQR
jgi:hypothetical protein